MFLTGRILYFKDTLQNKTMKIKAKTYHNYISRSVLYGSKQPQNDSYYVQKITKDGGPLESKEVKDLSLQGS